MHKVIVLKIAVLVSLCAANQAFALRTWWSFTVTNWSDVGQDVEAIYPGCTNDRFRLAIGETKTINAKDCLLSEIKVHGTTRQRPYKFGGGQRKYKKFYILGPVNGDYLVGRLE